MNNMPSFDSVQYVNEVVKQLIFEYDHASTGTTPVLVGTAREVSARKKFEMLLPSGIGVGTGCVIDSYKNTSKQTDMIIYEKEHCPRFSINDTPEATYYPCEGVIAVGELKSRLGSSELDDAFSKIKSQKSCVRYNPNDYEWRKYTSSVIYEGSESERYNQCNKPFHQIYGFILCNEFAISVETLLEKIKSKCNTEEAHLLPNCIVSLKDGMVFYINCDKNKLCEDKSEATGVAFSHNSGQSTQFLINKIYTYIRNGVTKQVPYDRYILKSTSISKDGYSYKAFND